MANEITERVFLSISKDGSTVTFDKTITRTLTGSGNFTETQTIGTSAEALDLPTDLGTEGVTAVAISNLDATNYVEISLDSGMTKIFAKIPAGRSMILPPYTSNPAYFARANTAPVNIKLHMAGT